LIQFFIYEPLKLLIRNIEFLAVASQCFFVNASNFDYTPAKVAIFGWCFVLELQQQTFLQIARAPTPDGSNS
jgi:hypothetical protein